MNPNTVEKRARSVRSWISMAGAVGAAAGVAALVYRQSQRDPWEKAKRKLTRAAEAARDQAKPWMGLVAGAAAGSAALAYWLQPKPTPWEQARRSTRQIALRTQRQVRPWIGLAASTAIGLASAAYSRRDQARKSALQGVTMTADKLAETGLQLLRRVQHISGEARKLYPEVRKLIA